MWQTGRMVAIGLMQALIYFLFLTTGSNADTVSSFVTSNNYKRDVVHNHLQSSAKEQRDLENNDLLQNHGNQDSISKSTTRKEYPILAKTKETFKLAELYCLEASLQSKMRKMKYERLAIDASTGSCLLSLDKDLFPQMNGISPANDSLWPSMVYRFDWLAEPLAFGSTAEYLVEDIVNKNGLHNLQHDGTRMDQGFTIEYVTFSKVDDDTMVLSEKMQQPGGIPSKTKRHTSKTLICRVSQVIQYPASLYNSDDSLRLLLIESPIGIYLTKQHSLTNLHQAPKSVLHLKRWSTRPFQYSSAINPTLGAIVIDMIHDFLLVEREQKKEHTGAGDIMNNKSFSLLDPCTGSGTFLGFAVALGMDVVGYDINSKCITGALKNLIAVFGEEFVSKKCRLEVGELSAKHITTPNVCYDCAIANLPWGQNTAITNKDENLKIISSMRKHLHRGSPCAIITKDQSYVESIQNMGFTIYDVINVPQRDFLLPRSKKKQKKKNLNYSSPTDTSRSSDCIVTFAVTL